MRWTVVVTAFAVALPGCLGGGNARDDSTPWHEPGLYAQLQAAEGDNKAEERRSRIAIPLDDPAVGAEWHDPDLIRINQGRTERSEGFDLSTAQRSDDGPFEIVVADLSYSTPDRAAFLAFVQRFVVRDEAGYAALADRYEESFVKQHGPYGFGVVVVDGPFKADGIFESLGPVVAASGASGVLWREGGGWNLTYLAPIMVLPSGRCRLEVAPTDVASFYCEGTSNLEDVELAARLENVMADLGRAAPAGVTFSHSHGD